MSLIVPAWLIVTMSGWKGLRSVWPAVLVCGVSFAIIQFAWSNYVGPELVDIVAGLISIAALAFFCRVWQPRDVDDYDRRHGIVTAASPTQIPSRQMVMRAWMPWLFLSVAVILWGLAPVKAILNGLQKQRSRKDFAALRGR